MRGWGLASPSDFWQICADWPLVSYHFITIQEVHQVRLQMVLCPLLVMMFEDLFQVSSSLISGGDSSSVLPWGPLSLSTIPDSSCASQAVWVSLCVVGRHHNGKSLQAGWGLRGLSGSRCCVVLGPCFAAPGSLYPWRCDCLTNTAESVLNTSKHIFVNINSRLGSPPLSSGPLLPPCVAPRLQWIRGSPSPCPNQSLCIPSCFQVP